VHPEMLERLFVGAPLPLALALQMGLDFLQHSRQFIRIHIVQPLKYVVESVP
jgi:hypothetical protein